MLEAQLESNPYKLVEKPHKNSKWTFIIFLPVILAIQVIGSYHTLTDPEAPVWVFPFILLVTIPWFFILPIMAFRYYTFEVDKLTRAVRTTYKLLFIKKTRQYEFSEVDLLSVKIMHSSSGSLFALSLRTYNGKDKFQPIVLKPYQFANSTAKTLARIIGCRVRTWEPTIIYPKSNREI